MVYGVDYRVTSIHEFMLEHQNRSKITIFLVYCISLKTFQLSKPTLAIQSVDYCNPGIKVVAGHGLFKLIGTIVI